MKRSFLALALLSLLCSACSSVPLDPSRPTPPWTPIDDNWSQSDRLKDYASQKVENLEGPYARVNGYYYDSRGMLLYYKAAHAKDAFLMQHEARKTVAKSWFVPGITVAVFYVVGYEAGVINWDATHYNSYGGSDSSLNGAATGAAIGAGLGLVTGLIEHFVYQHSAERQGVEAAESFNRAFLKRLNFKVQPAGGGAKASVGASF